jgi:hypothetical protein
MHGYEVNATLENRKIRDWAAVARPQIYYSLEKLTRLGLIRVTDDGSSSAGPERRIFQTMLEEEPATGRCLQRKLRALLTPGCTFGKPFQTWLALS